MEPLDLLCNAWALIADPKDWITGVLWEDENGETYGPPTKFCAVGAVEHLVEDTGNYLLNLHLVYRPLNLAAFELYDLSLALINDYRGHDAVERVFALAAAMMEDA